ncbi:MAG: glycosyltransferase family 2 protein [Candidatus Omnitrophota bacterium]|jgi:glycosyltransferase involved in cell wall biosynthesis
MNPISVIVPAYKEAGCVGKVIDSIKNYMQSQKLEHEIIVVDDDSRDGTADEAKKHGAKVISHPINRGYGAALTTGIKNSKFEHILIIDADETYPVTEIGKLVPFMGDFDMVVGARQGKYFHGSTIKRLSRMAFYMLLNFVTGENIPDANSGLRIFKKSVVMQFEEDFCSGFSFTTTITIILLSNRYLVKFVPIDYKPRTGKSKVKYLRDTARTVQILLQNISYYNPIKAFLPFSAISFLMAVVFMLCYFFKGHNAFYCLPAVISFLSSLLFMCFGMMAYVIVKGNKTRT